jgi:hypothetical protein
MASHRHDETGNGPGVPLRNQQMDVVGHQYLGMQRALFALWRLPPPAKIGVIILLVEETGPAIVAALHEMQRHTIKMDSGRLGMG